MTTVGGRELAHPSFYRLNDVPPELEWFANISNPNMRRAYRSDVSGFMAFFGMKEAPQFREVTRAHLLAWRKHLEESGSGPATNMHLTRLLEMHAWIWWLRGPAGGSRLSITEAAALDAFPSTQRPALRDISLWEVAMLVELGRLQLDRSLADWLTLDCLAVEVLPVTAAVATEVASLPASFHRDQADRLVVATARVHALPLFSHDGKIRQSGLVAIWTPTPAQTS